MKLHCPHCQQKYEIPDEYNGKSVECSICNKEFVASPKNNDQEISSSHPPIQSTRKNTNTQWWTCISDIFHVRKLRADMEEQKSIVQELGLIDILEKRKITDDLHRKINIQKKQLAEIKAKTQEEQSHLQKLESRVQKINELLSLDSQIKQKEEQLDNLKIQIIETEDEVLMQSFGLYKPSYDFASSDQYKDRLNSIRNQQKEMIKEGNAFTGNQNWTVNGSISQGRKMVSDMQKLLLRAFNGECEEITDRVTYANFEASTKRITTSFEAISKLGKIMDVAITNAYCNLKREELKLAFEFRQKKQEEKERQKELRAQMREEERVQRELEETRKKIEKEQTHYMNAILQLNNQFESAADSEKQKLNEKKLKLETKLGDINKSLEDIDYREANQKAGYVYIISNIGAFGENIYKIGMTRRLDPTERIDELGDASVPFDFDIHAMIFSENAPALETALHHAFERQKLNWVNQRREFFNVSLDEIKNVIKANHEKTAEFIDVAPAEQYRVSLKMKQDDIIIA